MTTNRAVQMLLRDPSQSDLLYGFDNLAKTLLPLRPELVRHATEMYGLLVKLSEAVGGRAAEMSGVPS